MATYRNSRTLPAIFTTIIIIVAIVGLIALVRLIFFSGPSTSVQSPADISRQALLDTTSGSAVSMTVRGPIVANENFRSYKIVISPNERDMKTYTGYLNTILKQDSLPNNVAAYDQFVHALDKLNMSAGKQLSDENNDFRGACATGKLYEFSIIKDDKVVRNLWTTTCSGSAGSLRSSASQLAQLFQKQIPEANSLLSGLSL